MLHGMSGKSGVSVLIRGVYYLRVLSTVVQWLFELVASDIKSIKSVLIMEVDQHQLSLYTDS